MPHNKLDAADEVFSMSVALPYARPKLYLALWVTGMLGFALIIFTVLPELLPKLLEGRELPFPIWVLSAIGLLQGAVLLVVAVLKAQPGGAQTSAKGVLEVTSRV